MEIYTGQGTLITVPMPTGFIETTVELLDVDGERIYYNNPAALHTNSIDVTIPYRAVKIDSTLKLVVKFSVDGFREEKEVELDVVTPILPLDDIRVILDPDDAASVTDATASNIERRVRIAIQNFTGQVFGPYKGIITVYGNNDSGLKLPRPILDLESVNFNGFTATVLSNVNYLIKGNRFYLEVPSPLFWSIKDAPPDDVLDSWSSLGPITAPMSTTNSNYNNFRSKIAYDVKGTFGYLSVPYDVAQAARYLINDYSCDESLWRDRYIDNIRAADWRFQFRAAAFDGTGNVQADQILEGYRPHFMSVI